MKKFQKDSLKVQIYAHRSQAGQAAGQDVIHYLNTILATQGHARVIFASAPSQDDLLKALTSPSLPQKSLDWSKITAFHLDEYIGLNEDHPASFRAYLKRQLFSKVTPFAFHGIQGESVDPQTECNRYARLLAEKPVDAVCLGIGENGHLAFNDPPVADFNDPQMVKKVPLENSCRVQQVHDGCFTRLEEVPQWAITLTIPTLVQAKALFCMVPGSRKAQAVRHCLEGEISTRCPASILRRHPNATLYLDQDSASALASF